MNRKKKNGQSGKIRRGGEGRWFRYWGAPWPLRCGAPAMEVWKWVKMGENNENGWKWVKMVENNKNIGNFLFLGYFQLWAVALLIGIGRFPLFIWIRANKRNAQLPRNQRHQGAPWFSTSRPFALFLLSAPVLYRRSSKPECWAQKASWTQDEQRVMWKPAQAEWCPTCLFVTKYWWFLFERYALVC